jgi:dipeptidyl-peptidase-4
MFKKSYFASLLTALCLMLLTSAHAQQKKNITVEDIWQRNTFRMSSVHGVDWMKNGQFYTSQVQDNNSGAAHVIRYNITTGQIADTVFNGNTVALAGRPFGFDSYGFSPDETKILFATETEPIYRRSFKASYFIYDLGSRQLTPLSTGGKQSYATFSPDGSKVAFTRDNNLFYVDLASKREIQITKDGEFNKIINGSTDWVYEEEFSFAQAFFWSPDGKKIAFYTFDESEVKEYNMQVWGTLYPVDYRFKYPKAGEKNSVVGISVYHLDNNNIVKMDVGPEKDQYIARINWTQNPDLLSMRRMNRLQNKLEVLHAEANTGKSNVVLTEKADTYIDINDDLTYLQDGKHFIFSSELGGYKHIYLYDINGKLKKQITRGNWEVDEVVGVDEKRGVVYFTSTEVSPMERHFYSINLNGKNKKKLSEGAGTHTINMSTDFKYYLDYYSSANVPVVVKLHEGKDGKMLRVLEDNKALNSKLASYDISPLEFFSFKTPSEGVSLNGYMIKPSSFEENKKYPVLMFVYGGPGSQQVKDSWTGGNYLWYQMLAQKGYIVVCVDNRGTGGRGAEFKKVTYANLGKYETVDQIETAKYLGSLPYVDKSRIGIWGWSFGGYMTSLAMTLGADYFKTGIAVAPVTNWRFYDSIYTERYLKTPQLNASGYDDNSPVTYADRLKGKYLLIHGTGDDNVHFQNAVAMQDALIKANKQFESFYYPNRNHGIYGGNTRLHLYKMMTDFLDRNLMGDGSAINP